MNDPVNEQSPPVDMDFLRSVTDGDAAFTRQLFETFLNDAEAGLSKLEQAMNPFKPNLVRSSVHPFVGTASCLGAYELREKAASLEANAVAAKHRESQETYEQFCVEVKRTIDFIKSELARLNEPGS